MVGTKWRVVESGSRFEIQYDNVYGEPQVVEDHPTAEAAKSALDVLVAELRRGPARGRVIYEVTE